MGAALVGSGDLVLVGGGEREELGKGSYFSAPGPKEVMLSAPRCPLSLRTLKCFSVSCLPDLEHSVRKCVCS